MADKTLQIKIGTRNIPSLRAFFDSLPSKQRGVAIRAASEYMLMRFKVYPPYKLVRRAKAYPNAAAGPGWFSEKQRRFVMASLRAGRNLKTGSPMEPGYPHRTGNLQRAWRIEGKDINLSTIRNDHPAAIHAFGNTRQARQLGQVGWKKLDTLVNENIAGALDAAAEAVIKEFVL
jgi:hypothetical protein